MRGRGRGGCAAGLASWRDVGFLGSPGTANDSIAGPAPPRGKSCNAMRDLERNPPTPAARIAANGTGRKMTLLARPRRGCPRRPSPGIRLVVAAAPNTAASIASTPCHSSARLCYELADDFFDLYEGYTTSGKVQDNGLVSKNVARISLNHDAPAGTLDRVAMEIDAAAGALFAKRDKLGSVKRYPTK